MELLGPRHARVSSTAQRRGSLCPHTPAQLGFSLLPHFCPSTRGDACDCQCPFSCLLASGAYVPFPGLFVVLVHAGVGPLSSCRSAGVPCIL